MQLPARALCSYTVWIEAGDQSKIGVNNTKDDILSYNRHASSSLLKRFNVFEKFQRDLFSGGSIVKDLKQRNWLL